MTSPRQLKFTFNCLLGNRFTKVNRLSSESLFVFRNDLYVNILYCKYTCYNAKVVCGRVPCTSTGRVGLCFLWFFVQELPKAQPAVVLVLKRLRRLGNGLKSHPTDCEKPGIEPATPGLQDKMK